MDEIDREKRKWRQEFLALRKRLHSAEKDAAIRAKIAALAGASFFVYYSMGSEVDTRALIAELLQNGKKVCLPRIEKGSMLAAPYTGGEMRAGAYGIPAPESGGDCDCDIILAPLLAADKKGNRLGFGGGFYDRYFASHPHALRVGLCYAGQVVQELPAAEHDVRLHAIVTERGIECFSKT